VRAPRAEALRGQLNSLELRRIETAREYTPASRIMQDLDAQIRAIRAQIATAEKTEVGNWTPNPIRQGLLSDIARLEGQLRAEDARIAALGRATQRAKSSLDELPAHAYNLNRLNTDQEVLATTYRQLNQQFQTLRLSEEARANENRIFYPAELAPNPVAPRRLVNIAAAAILGLILALVAAVVSDQLDPRVHNTADVERAGGLPVLAHVPAIASANGQSLLGAARPHPALLESYRMLRARLATGPGAPPLRSIVVAGPRGGEGTSTVAANLAAAIALSGRRVLLVDADLRRPALHRRLGLPNERGLSSVLGGSEVLAAALQATAVPRLSVLTAGPTVENAAELLSTEAGQRELLAIARHADVVVFDAPAVLAYADALSLSSLADAAVLVASEDESSRRDIERACDLLAQTGTLLPGIVLNKAVQDTPKHLKRSGDNSNSDSPSGGPGGRSGNSIVAHATQGAESQVAH
jgi:capsular exopolysaccharide synthesis family protein